MTTNLSTLPAGSYSWEKRMNVVARYMLHGNARLVAELEDISYDTLMDWRRTDWWGEMVETLRRQRKQKTNDHLVKVVETSLEIVQERLENGDFVLNQKTGEIIRKPVTAKEAGTIANNLIARQLQIDDTLNKVENKQESIQDTLAMLAKEFQKLSLRERNKEAIDVEVKEVPDALYDERETRLQERSGEVHQSP